MGTELPAAASLEASWLSPSEVAQPLGSSRWLVDRLVRDGRLETDDADGRPVRISAASLARYSRAAPSRRPRGACAGLSAEAGGPTLPTLVCIHGGEYVMRSPETDVLEMKLLVSRWATR